ncbi:MAG: CHAT domain-containing protein [Bacteroidota bacterium]
MNTFSLLLRFLALSPMLLGLIACQEDEIDLMEKSEGDILSVTFDLPDNRYQLGTVGYRDLLDEAVFKKGTEQQKAALAQVNVCKDMFEGGNLAVAMDETAKLLSGITYKEEDALDSLITAEALYVFCRTFFYSKNTSYEPANGLLFQAMHLSGSMIHAQDSMIQILALFQLARQHDVWEGLTKRYGQWIQNLSEEEWLYAASTALRIKDEYLGLDGPPLMRSLGNLFADYRELKGFGMSYSAEELHKVTRRGLQIVEKLEQAHFKEYAELAVAFLMVHTGQSIVEGKEDTARKYLTIWLRMQTDDPEYVLGDPISSLSESLGLTNYASFALPHRLEEFKEQFGTEELEATRKTLLNLFRERTENRYKEGRVHSRMDVRNAFQLNVPRTFDFPILGQEAFELFQDMTSFYFVQNKELWIDQKISSEDQAFQETVDKMRVWEDSLKHVEMALSHRPTQSDFWACYEINQQISLLRKEVHKKRAKHLFELDLSPLSEIQASLASNELWLTFMSGNRNDYVAICGKDYFVIDSLPLRSTSWINNTQAIILKTQLTKKIVQAEDWTSEEQSALRALANICFRERIPQGIEHIVISCSDMGFKKAMIWDVLVEEYMRNSIDPTYSLKSIRYSDQFLDHMRPQEEASLRSTKLIAIAPKFRKPEINWDETGAYSLAEKMQRAERDKYRLNFMPLLYNIPEVLAIGDLVKGKIMVGDETSEETFLKQDLKGAVLHFSSHAVSDAKDALRSGIVLSGDNIRLGIGIKDNILHFHEIRKLDLDAELVVLSACQTGTGPKREGGFQWTLANAFREAGCENIISSVWNVHDKATHDIMIEFYRRLIQGKGKAEALYAAKEQYRKDNPTMGPHYWAPFTLYGDNQPVKLVAR